jgi:CheY-like chemotaxis protein
MVERRDFHGSATQRQPGAPRTPRGVGPRGGLLGAKAVEAVREQDFDLVLMDMQMPELDGAGATREIRRLPGAASRVPIVALTADALPGFREQYMQSGLDDYLTKPVDWNALDRVLLRFAPPRAP